MSESDLISEQTSMADQIQHILFETTVIEEVFNHLDGEALVRCQRVCRQFHYNEILIRILRDINDQRSKNKRKHTGFHLYVKVHVPILKENGTPVKRIMGEIAQMWRALSEEEQKLWKDKIDAVELGSDSLLKLMFKNMSEKQLLAKYVGIEVKNDNKQKPLVIKRLEEKLHEMGYDVFIERRCDPGPIPITWVISFKWGESWS